MAHVRKQIRDAFATLLTGLTTTGSNVFVAPTEPIPMDNTPALEITTPDDARESASNPVPRTFERTLSIQVMGHTYQANPVDLLDTIAVEVETAVASNVTLGGLCQLLILNTTEIVITGESATPTGYITMNFTCKYVHKENTPEVAI